MKNRHAIAPTLAALALLAGCQKPSTGDNVRTAYDNQAAAIDQQAAQQPTATAQKIYKARADAIREEGQDREKGLEGGTPTSGPGSGSAPGGGGAKQ